jgi:hypothetical protein
MREVEIGRIIALMEEMKSISHSNVKIPMTLAKSEHQNPRREHCHSGQDGN